MKKISTFFVFVIIFLSFFYVNALLAQETFNIFGGDKPVVISSDEPYIINNNEQGDLVKLEFKKNVLAKSEDFRLFASGSLIYFKKDELVIAEGNVVEINQGKAKITCKKAEFFVNEDKSIFTGNPRIEQGEGNVSEGSMITLMKAKDGSSTMIVTPFTDEERDTSKQGRAVLHYEGSKPKETPAPLTKGPKEIKIEEETNASDENKPQPPVNKTQKNEKPPKEDAM